MNNNYQNTEPASSFFMAEVVLGNPDPENKSSTLFRKVVNVNRYGAICRKT